MATNITAHYGRTVFELFVDGINAQAMVASSMQRIYGSTPASAHCRADQGLPATPTSSAFIETLASPAPREPIAEDFKQKS